MLPILLPLLNECGFYQFFFVIIWCEFYQEPIDGKYVIDGGFSFTGNDLSHGNETLFIGKLLSNKLIDFSFLNN